MNVGVSGVVRSSVGKAIVGVSGVVRSSVSRAIVGVSGVVSPSVGEATIVDSELVAIGGFELPHPHNDMSIPNINNKVIILFMIPVLSIIARLIDILLSFSMIEIRQITPSAIHL